MVMKVGCFLLAIPFSLFAAGAVSSPLPGETAAGAQGSLSGETQGASAPRLFASSFNQGIVELDPATGQVLNTFASPVANNVVDAMAFDGDSLYFLNAVSDPANIYELDPNTGAVIAAHPFAANAFMEGMASLNGLLYILDRAADDIIVFDPGDDSLVGTIDVNGANPENPDADLSGGLAGIRMGGDGLIASTAGDNIVEIDPATGQIVNSFAYTGSPVGGDIGLGVVNGQIFVGNNTGPAEQIVVYSRAGGEIRRLTVAGSIGIQSIGADDAGGGRPALTFPQYADGQAAGFRNVTRIVLAARDEAESGEVRFYDEDGAPQSLSVDGEVRSVVPFDLDPQGSVEIVTDGVGALTSGSVEVFSERGAGSRLGGSEIFELLGSSVSVPDSPPRSSQRAYVNFSQEERTAIAVFNPDRLRSVELRLRLLGTDGLERATATLTLEPGQRRAIFLDDATLFAQAVSGGFRGLLLVESETLPVSLLSLIQKRETGALVVVILN